MRAKIALLFVVIGMGFCIFYGARYMKIQQYRKIAVANCSTCHLFPEPNLLSKDDWITGVMPEMGKRMGRISIDIGNMEEADLSLYSKPALVSDEDWNKILAYYAYAAPDKPVVNRTGLKLNLILPVFQPMVLRANPGVLPQVSMLRFLPKSGQLLVGTHTGGLFRYNLKKSKYPIDSIFVRSAPSWADYTVDGQQEILVMGQITPNDHPIGRLFGVVESTEGRFFAQHKVQQLKRPVHFSKSDLNNDGQDDYLICEFGHLTGKLSLHLSQRGDTLYQEKVLKAMPGARITYCLDMDGDKKKDILALMTQGDEKIVLFKNKGKAQFEEQELLRFPPVYGSSYLEVKDMNQDGLLDLVYSLGDNLDYSYSLKAYHGIRIFLNRGNNKFTEKTFLPQHGVGMVMAEDFDQDGDQDIASIAYFPDYNNNPNEGFIYYENRGNLKFNAFSFPGSQKAKWLVMEKGDFDADGDVDLAIGALTMNNGEAIPKQALQRFEGEGIEVLLLINQLKQ